MSDQFPLEQIIEKFDGRLSIDQNVIDMPCVIVKPEDLVELCYYLRDEENIKFNFFYPVGNLKYLQ